MAYYVFEDFSKGIDRRRLIDTTGAGALWDGVNVFVNEGGQIEKRLAFTEVGYLTGAFRHAKNNTIVARGMATDQILLLGHVDRDTLYAAGKWPHDSATVKTPWTWGALQFFWLDPYVDTGGGDVDGYQWMTLSVAFQASVMEGSAFTGYDSQDRKSYTEIVEIPYDVTAGGVERPGGANGTWQYKTADASLNTRQLPRFKASHKTKIFEVSGYEISSGNVSGGGTGSGSSVILDQEGFVGVPVALAPYYSELAIFGEAGLQFWTMAASWTSGTSFNRSMDQVPTVAPRSVTPYASGDTFFLSSDGIRSLQARDSSNLARVDDIGSPIDNLVREADPTDAYLAAGVVYAQKGQFWLFLEGYAYVLARHSSSKVLAWTRYSLPATDGNGTQDFTEHPNDSNYSLSDNAIGAYAADVVPAGLSVAFRTFEDRFFVYGGQDGATYDDSQALIQTPYFDFGKPATTKQFSAIDVACVGAWTIEVSIDPFNEVWEEIGTVENSTYALGRIFFQTVSEHLSIRLTSTDESRAVVGQIAVHYDAAQAG